MDIVSNANRICELAHKGQTRRDGSPYYLHAQAVAREFFTDTSIAIALLHDVLEDCGMEWGPIILQLCGSNVFDGVDVLTKKSEQSYEEYISSISQFADLVAIKKAYMRHNLSCNPTEEQKEKYKKAFKVFKDYYGGEND